MPILPNSWDSSISVPSERVVEVFFLQWFVRTGMDSVGWAEKCGAVSNRRAQNDSPRCRRARPDET